MNPINIILIVVLVALIIVDRVISKKGNQDK